MAVVRQKPSWVKYIHQRIKKNKNFIGIIMGPTGSGKSWTALAMAEMLDDKFGEDRIIFKARNFMSLINSGTLKSGSVILWDEAGIDLNNRNWQSVMNKMINYLFQTFRHRNFILLFTAPYTDFVDSASQKLFHAQFETMKINFQKNTCGIKPKLLQYNAALKKYYYHFLKVIREESQIKIKKWNVPKPSEKIIEAYEKKKNEFTKELNKEIEDAIKEIDNKKPKGQSKLLRPLTERQQMIIDELKNMNIGQVAKKVGISKVSVYEHINAARNKGVILRQVMENGQIICYEVENS